MTDEGWLLGLLLSLPLAGLALLAGQKAAHASRYWTMALFMAGMPLCLAPLLPWLALSAPAVLEPMEPIFAATQGLPGVGSVEPIEPGSGFDWATAFVGLWALGALWRGAVELWRSSNLSRITAGANPADPSLVQQVHAQACAMGVGRISIYIHHGPVMVTGLVHSRLYLNTAMLGSAASDQIIRHELAHILRHDVVTLSIARILGVVLWFNPFLFAIEARRRLAAELECDRLALAGHDDNGARLYARALLEAAGSNSGASPVVGFGVAPRKAIKMRMTSILSPTPMPKARGMLARSLVLGVSVAVLGSVQAAQATGSFAEPEFSAIILEGRDTSGFGPRVIEGLDVPPFHGGHDIAAPIGTPIRAPAAGVITYAGNEFRGNGNWGYVVEIEHGAGWTTVYAHLSGSMFGRGDRVEAGQIFATVGNTGLSTGPHLHVEVRENGERRDPALHLPGLASPAN